MPEDGYTTVFDAGPDYIPPENIDLNWSIWQGDSKVILQNMIDRIGTCWIDAIICDPPYNLKIAKWDYGVGDPEIYKLCFQLLKPGGFFAGFGAPRHYHMLANQLVAAKFKIEDMLIWRFPHRIQRTQSLKEDATKYVEALCKDPKVLNGRSPRKVRQQWEWYIEYNDGLRPRLKPSFDPICLARKPKKGTYWENTRKWGVGCMNIAEITEKGGLYPIGQKECGPDLGELKSAGVTRNPNYKAVRKGTGLGSAKTPNHHESVKPRTLMNWLVKMLCREGPGVVLDPFNGTASTGLGCIGWAHHYIGIEQNQEYCRISRERMHYWCEKEKISHSDGIFFLPGEEYCSIDLR